MEAGSGHAQPREAAVAPPRALPPARGRYRHLRVMTTRWSDNDIYGHLNNTVHHALADAAVNAWMIENGVVDIHAGQRIGLMVENGFRYFAEMAYPDRIGVGVGVTRIGASSVRWEIGLFREDEASAAAQGFFVHVYVDRATRKPTPLDAATRAALETVLIHD